MCHNFLKFYYEYQYKFHEQDLCYFITFAIIGWTDVFTRSVYRDILLDSFRYCQQNKGLRIHAYVIMTNHVHMIISRYGNPKLEDIVRDLKKFSASQLIKAIVNNPLESRKDWMIYLFNQAGKANSNNTIYQFWRQDNHPIELNPHFHIAEQKIHYIHNNPVAAGFVDEPTAWMYSSARNYAGLPTVLDCELL